MKKSKQEKGIQAETLDFPPEVQQPNRHVMVNCHQQIAEIPHKYSNSREYRPARNPNYVDQYSRSRQWSNDRPTQNYQANQWTSTPRDPREYWHNQSYNNAGDATFNNSLLNLLDSQHKVQQDTTHTLKK